MKKRLEAELISIAHRILKLKNKSELDQLHKETQKLYETLSVLKFYQDNFEVVKSEMPQEVLEEKLEQPVIVEPAPEPVAEEEEAAQTAPVDEPTAEAEEEVSEETETANEELEQPEPEVAAIIAEETEEEAEPSLEEEQPIQEEVTAGEEESEKELKTEIKPVFEPIFELEVEEEEEITPAEVASEFKSEEKLEDMIGNYAEPVFVKPDEVSLFPSEPRAAEPEKATEPEEPAFEVPKPEASVNEALSKSIAIGLNDRIGFVQHLFNGSNEDFNRVISQLNTFDTFEEAKNFINEMVIPDYDYWVGEEEYIERFMEIVEKKFQ